MRGARCLSKRAAGTLRWDGTAAAFTSPGRFVAFGGSQHRGQRQGRAAVWRWVAGVAVTLCSVLERGVERGRG
ncbi:unnamed protein product [Lampetra planeri]